MPSFRSGAVVGLLVLVLLTVHTQIFTSMYAERKGHRHLRDQVVRRARALRPVAFVTHHAPRLFAHPLLPSFHPRKRLSLAIVRTVSVRDGNALIQSFDEWTEHSLGEKCAAAGYYDVDLIISFSREFDHAAYPKISDAVDTTRDIFEKTGGWGGCIRSLKTFQAKISPEEDLYDSAIVEAGGLDWRKWVNGPNRQFERTFRHIQSLAEYDVMFLMEADTFPIADNWLDNLVEEIEASAPFALLGSKYNGNAWDEFADKMPLALLHHLNGNSVYNTSHPLLDHILRELEEEANTEYNAISYDYRISQMLLEGSTGVPPEFPYKNIFDENGKAIVLAPKPKFAMWWQQYSNDNPVQESSVISNIASTSYLQDEVDVKVSIVHGKNVYLPWNEDDYGSVSLVVSGFGAIDDPYKDFLDQIDSSHHPFSEIVVVMGSESTDDDLNSLRQWAQAIADVNVIVQRRTGAPNMDLCTAEVSTDYFMITSVNFAPLESIQLMFAADGTNRPVVSFVPSASAHCSSFKVCADTLEQARVLFPDMDRYFLSDEILYQKHLRHQFCDNLRRRREDGDLILRGGPAGIKIPGPSATNYMAFLYSSGIVRSTYIQSNAVIHGSRKLFVEKEPRTPASLQHHLLDVGNSSGSPLFWKIPRSGGTMVQTLCGHCFHLTIAASTTSSISTDSYHLRIVNVGNEKYVGVDLSTLTGVERASKPGLIESKIADVVITPLLNGAAKNLFTSEVDRRASVFALFRDPIERATSLFFHLKDLSKKGGYDPDFQNMTIEEYATSNIAENNWMVRMLNDEPSVVDVRHLEVAKEVLRRKVVVGLTSEMQESMKRFSSYFGWDLHDGWSPCEFSLLFGDHLNRNDHSTLKKQDNAWNLLAAKNSLDIKLYEHAVDLFRSQGQELFEPNSSKPTKHHSSLQESHPRDVVQSEETLRDILDLSLQRRMNDYPGDSTHTTPTCPEDKGSCCTTDDLPELEVDYVQATSTYTIILNGVEGQVGESFEAIVADAIYEYWAEVNDSGVVSVCVDITLQTVQGSNRKLVDTVIVQYETTTILDPTTSNIIEIDEDSECSDCDVLGEAPFSTPQLLNSFVEELKVKNVVSASEGSVSEPIFDSDGDGLGDEKEGTIGTDPGKPDTDFDGLSDKQEVDAGTNPLAPDSDLDGITDGQEAILGTDPNLKDTDKDGIADGQEVAQGTDPLVMDSDLDGLADGQEAILGTNPLLNDTDKDGIVDGQEIAQGTNPLALDSDLDGLTDGQEASLNTNPLLKDTDKDGLTDGTEVTLGTNPLLRDTDKDGIADAQEVAQGTDPLTVTCSGRDRGTCFGLTGCQWCEMKLECMESTRFLAECRASTCPDIKSLSFCNSHALCDWKDNKCVSNIFGGGRNNDNNKKGCMRLNNRRQAIKCLKKKRRKCNKKRNARKRNQCLRKVTKKIRQVKRNFRPKISFANLPTITVPRCIPSTIMSKPSQQRSQTLHFSIYGRRSGLALASMPKFLL